MRIKNLWKIYLDSLNFIVAYFVIIALVFWYQISPITFNEYNKICSSNYGIGDPDFIKCMDPYWSQYNIDKLGMEIFIFLAVMSALLFIFKKLKSRS